MRPCDADADSDDDGLISDLDRLAHCARDAVRDDPRFFIVAHVLEQNCELVAAEACDCVRATSGVEQSPRRDDEELIARAVTHAVVHRLEVVDVEEHHHHAVTTCRSLQRHLDPLSEQRAVREVCEWIVRRLMREAILQRFALADVLYHRDDAKRFTGGAAVCA